MNFPILSYLIFLPLLGALLLVTLPNKKYINHDNFYRSLTLTITLITFVLSLFIWGNFDPSLTDVQFVEKKEWLEGYNIYYYLGVDGFSILFVVLTTFLMPICILSSWSAITHRVREFMVSFLIMESLILGVFCALDFLLFFLFFESVLIPMYLIIGIWGGKERVYAAFKFFLYTFAGSVFLLISIIYIYYQLGTTDMILLTELAPNFSLDVQKWLWLAFFISFAIKVPMWPFHTWLPDAHVQAPTAGSVILAGVLLKLGGYGFLRLSLPLLPDASQHFANFIMWLSVIAIIYTSLVALMQEDMKKLIAYSSIAHMGFVTAGLFSLNQQGIEGAIFQMISHGLVSGALFLCVGVLYDRMHTREIAYYNGLTNRMPKYAFHFMVFMLASVGLPATSGFIGEFMALLGIFKYNKMFSALATLGIILGAAYMLWLYARIMFGEIKNAELKSITDLNRFELVSFWPLTIAVIILGIYPNILLDYVHSTIKNIDAIYISQSEKKDIITSLIIIENE
jgi:NADH-quinone oxidoreductase subunit M